MRRAALAGLAVLALSGCEREPTFDERYDALSRDIDNRMNAIDNEIAAQGMLPDPGGEGDGTDQPETLDPARE